MRGMVVKAGYGEKLSCLSCSHFFAPFTKS